MGKKWVPLESNPEVLNEFASRLGLDTSAYAFTDVFGLDEELLAMVPQPTIAVVLLFPVGPDEQLVRETGAAASSSGVFFIRQTIGNACGTIAVLHSVENNRDKVRLVDGSFLQKFFEATKDMNAEERGKFLEYPPKGAPDIEEAHKAAAAEGSTAAPSAEEDVNLHFTTFVEKEGLLYELDGRRVGPVAHGSTAPDTLLHDTVAVIKQVMERTNSHQFNVIALSAAS